MAYQYYQPNDMDLKDRFYDDPIRALTKVMDKSWLEVFDGLVPIARDLQCSFLEKDCYEKFLTEQGFVYKGISNKKGSKRPTVESFARKNHIGRFFVNVANHTVAVANGAYYNTWDCGYKCIYGIWALPDDMQYVVL